MDVLNDLHADFAAALRDATAAVSKLGATWQQLLEHLGGDAPQHVAEDAGKAAAIASTVTAGAPPANPAPTSPAAGATTPPTTGA